MAANVVGEAVAAEEYTGDENFGRTPAACYLNLHRGPAVKMAPIEFAAVPAHLQPTSSLTTMTVRTTAALPRPQSPASKYPYLSTSNTQLRNPNKRNHLTKKRKHNELLIEDNERDYNVQKQKKGGTTNKIRKGASETLREDQRLELRVASSEKRLGRS